MTMQVSGDTAINITFYSVTLQAIADPAGLPTAVSFEFGTDTTYGYEIIPDPDTLTGISPVAFQVEVMGIASGTNYHFRVKTQNSSGTFFGEDHLFTTDTPPPGNFTFKPEKCLSKTDIYTDLGTNGTVIPVSNDDDSNSGPLDIGFDFSYSGATFSQFILNTILISPTPPWAQTVIFISGLPKPQANLFISQWDHKLNIRTATMPFTLPSSMVPTSMNLTLAGSMNRVKPRSITLWYYPAFP